MIDTFNFDSFERPCPKCGGSGRIENPIWIEFWNRYGKQKDFFRALDLQNKEMTMEALQDQPVEPMFLFCKKCSGKGKILTQEGERFIKFVRFWMNDNYLE